ncbi:MAG: hypothetical protein K8W52_07730 [Deltaproteobacteria bacterium]|nr:hypothetical protein [Deltaproteobacteria bacterium]
MIPETVAEFGGYTTTIVGEPAGARVAMILVHGTAMTPADLAPFAHSMALPGPTYLPLGPIDSELVPGVPQGRAWWPTDAAERLACLAQGARDLADTHPVGLEAARARFDGLLDAVLATGVPTIVVGFSAGGMLAFDALVHRARPIAALALLSSCRIGAAAHAALLPQRPLAGVPTLISHGDADDDLAFFAGEALRDAAIAAGADVTWLPFAGGHQVPLVVWRRLRKLALAIARP